MVSRPTPPPAVRKAATADSDDSWDQLIDGAFADPDRASKDESAEDIFDCPTTIPSSLPGGPEDALELEFPPQSTFSTALTDDLPPTRRIASDTAIPRVLERRPSPPPPGMTAVPVPTHRTGEHASPLELVETYRRATGAIPTMAPVGLGDSPGRAKGEGGSLGDMKDRYAVGDYTGALVVAESILDLSPGDEDAKRYAQSCREVLTQMYAARLGPMDQVATVAVPPEQITWLSLDHRAGFLLSLVDGISSIEEILDISGMTRLDALRIMYTLVQQNVITLDQRA